MKTEPEHVYHIYHHPRFDLEKPFARIKLRMPLLQDPAASETKLVQSLRNDMRELRRLGAAKGIVDPAEETAGPSTHGRQLLVLKVGKGQKHKVLITGGHHGNEWSSVEVPYLIAKFLIESYVEEPSVDESVNDASLAEQKRIKHLLDNREIWFIPMVNPDGHYRAMTKDRTWRTNCRRHEVKAQPVTRPPGGWAEDPVYTGPLEGVDLNRNYPTLTWNPDTLRLAYEVDRLVVDGKCWGGLRPGSELETQAMAKLIRTHRFKASISYHNYSRELIYFHADKYVRHVAKGMEALSKYKLRYGPVAFPSAGHIADYCYEYAPGQPTLGLELPPHYKQGTPEDHGYSWVRERTLGPTFRENLPAALALINSAGFSQPPGEVKVCVDSGTQVVQVVQHDWKVFAGWQLGTAKPADDPG